MLDTDWIRDHTNLATFVMIDSFGTEVTGLDGLLTILVAKNGGAFNAAAGSQAEMGNGWYKYLSTEGEADTVGPISIVVTGAGCVQQNLEYVVDSRVPNMTSYEYPVTDSVTLLPIPGATVDIYTDALETHWIWRGVTDEFGHPRDSTGDLPLLQIGKTYYFHTELIGYDFSNPDAEVIS